MQLRIRKQIKFQQIHGILQHAYSSCTLYCLSAAGIVQAFWVTISEAALQIQAQECASTHSSICAEKYKPSLGRGHGKSEPRSVGVLENAHGMTLLLQRTKTPGPQLCVCFAVSPKVKVFRSPSGTFCPKARGLSPQHMWEQAPCVFAARPCFSCPQRMHCMLNATPNQKANQVPTNPWYSAACLLQLYIALSCQLPKLRKHSEQQSLKQLCKFRLENVPAHIPQSVQRNTNQVWEEGMKEWAPFGWRSWKRSWHDFAAAKDQNTRTTTLRLLRCKPQSQGLPVSQWHFLSQGTRTFPTAYVGASSLCVRCAAMLFLPPKNALHVECNSESESESSSKESVPCSLDFPGKCSRRYRPDAKPSCYVVSHFTSLTMAGPVLKSSGRHLEIRKNAPNFHISTENNKQECVIHLYRVPSNSRAQRVKTQPLTDETHEAGQ